ncbi:MAG: hypothetical protein Q8L07_14710 [Sediminibacterium sp.]|nr:hypothetical protein [Sediminibacterium sp.]
MYQILIAQKQAIVYATINSNEDWLLICPLFTKLHECRYSLQNLNTCLINSFNGNTMPIENVKDLLKERTALLSLLIEVLAKDQAGKSIAVLNAVLYHQRKTSSLLQIAANMPEQTILSKSQLQQWLTVLEIATTPEKIIKSDRREVLNFQQNNSFIYQSTHYGAYAYRYR